MDWLNSRTRFLRAFGCLLLAATGCGGSSATAPVEGTVTLEGAPLAGAVVSLDDPTKLNVEGRYSGRTDEQGRFSLGAIDDKGGGVVPGVYRVSITTAHIDEIPDENTKLPPERVPPHYRDGSVEFTVPEGGKTDVRFDLKRR